MPDPTTENLVAEQAQKSFWESAVAAFKNGNPIVAAGLGVGALTIAGSLFAASEYNEHTKKANLKLIHDIEALRTKRLTIQSPNSEDDIVLPAIFEFEKDNPEKAKSAYFTQQELINMIQSRGAIDTGLSPFSDDITSAMRQLYAFYLARFDRHNYFSRGEDSDVTSAVLRYLIKLLHDHAKKFSGYSRTIAILTGIEGFITEYSLMHGTHSERRARLQPVCNKIAEAILKLQTHSKKLSLEDLIGESWPDCEEVTRKMLFAYTKLISSPKDWVVIDRWADIQTLAKGIIKPEFEVGSWGTHKSAIFLEESPFSNNLIILAKNFVKAKSNATFPFVKDRTLPESSIKTNNFTQQERKQIYYLLTHVMNNFLTLIAKRNKPYSANSHLVLVEAEKDLAMREAILIEFSQLIAEMISCIKLFFRLSKYAQDMGELFIANPKNGQFLFEVLLSLGQQINVRLISLETKFMEIEILHKNSALAPEQKDLMKDIRQYLSTAKDQLLVAIERILKHRTHMNFAEIKLQINLGDHEILEIAHDVAIAHNIDHGHDVTCNNIHPHNIPVASRSSHGSNNQDAMAEMKYTSEPQEEEKAQVENKTEDLDELLVEVEKEIRKNELPSLSDSYRLIYHTLKSLRYHAAKMDGEESMPRHIKSQKIKKLTAKLSHIIVAEINDKNKMASALLAELHRPDNFFIDVHSTWYGRFFSFRTTTRHKTDTIENVCQKLLSQN